MALPSNRSSSPSFLSGRTSPNSRSSEISNPIRRSFSGNQFSKQSIVANPRGLNPITPANSPSDYPRRNSVNRENSFTSRDIPEKENGKDQSPKPVRVRSPIVGKSSKHFMSPTISAASKIAVSPRKKVLGDRNEPARSSISFSGTKSSSLNSVNRSLEAPEALESDTNSQIPPVSNSKTAKTVRFGGFEVISDSFDDSESTYRDDLNPEMVVTMAGESDMTSENAQVSKSTNAVAPSESSNSEFEVISVSNNDLDSPPAKSNLTEEVDCVNLDLDQSFKISPVSSPTIAPLDADPSLPPYDPKTNYLSPRPQFLHYRPNRRINRFEPDGRLEEKLLSFANVSESESVEETDSEDSSKELDEASSNGSQMEEEEDEAEEEEEGINVSEQSPTKVQKSWKVSVSRIFKISSLLLILCTACFSIYVVNVHDPSIFKRPSSLTREDASEIYELAKTNFNVFVQKLEVWNVNSISFISDMVFNFRGGLPLVHYENQTEFFNLNEQCLVLSHQTVWEEENTLNVMEAMTDRETDIFEEPIEIEERQEEEETDILEEPIGIEKRQEEEEIGIFEEPVERESENEEQEQERQVDLLQEIEAMKMREIGIENFERESQNEEELEEVSFQGSEVNAIEEEKNGEVFEEPSEEINEETSENSASDELCEEEEYIQEKSEDNFKFSSSEDFKFHDQIKQEEAAATGETEGAKNTEFQYQSVSSPAEHQPDFEHEIEGRTIDVIRTETGISRNFTQTKAKIISAILLCLSLVTAGLIYGRKSGSKPPPSSIAEEEQVKEQPLMNTSRVEEKDDEKDDMGGEFSISETSSFQYSSMREGETKADKRLNEVESHSHGRRKMKKNSRRESMASSSLDEYSLSTSASPSYGSFTTYEKIPIKHVNAMMIRARCNFMVRNPVLDVKRLGFRMPVMGRRTVWCSRRRMKGRVGNGVKATMQVDLEDEERLKRLEGLEATLGLDIVAERELKEKGFLGMRKTKLVCTIGPACSGIEDLEKLALEGMNIARLNMCHNSMEWHCDMIKKIKKLNEEKGFCISVMIDIEGSRIHVVDHGAPSSVKVEDGSIWLFTAKKFEGSRPFTVQASYEGFSEGIRVGDSIVIDGGMATFEVIEKIGNDLSCRCTDPGLFLPRAKCSFWRDGRLVMRNHESPTLSSKDWSDIEFGISEGVDFIALSFVNTADPVRHLKNYLLTKSAKSIRVLAKIESLEALQNLEEIVEASDGIMVARGDLGVEIPLEQIPAVQEEITRVCRELNKPVIIASQLLESMVEYPTPTRAEVADVSEAVRQYADALMLSGESAIGSYGQKALSVLQMASSRMELWSREENRNNFLPQHQLGVSLHDRIAEEICNSAAELANRLSVDAIFVLTNQGHMASLLSRNRPGPPIFALTDDDSTRMALNLQWGVFPLRIDLSEDIEANISRGIEVVKSKGLVKQGDSVLVVSEVSPARAASMASQSIQLKTIV